MCRASDSGIAGAVCTLTAGQSSVPNQAATILSKNIYMLSSVCVGTNDMKNSAEFYDAVLATIGMNCVFTDSHEKGYAAANGIICFYLVIPFNEQPATYGNGTQIIFTAANTEEVKSFYETALNHGGTDEGAPGPRDYHPDYYGAYVRDPDGNKLHVAIAVE